MKLLEAQVNRVHLEDRMATLNNDEIRRGRKKRRIFWMIMCIMLILMAPLLGEVLDKTMNGLFREFGSFEYDFDYQECLILLLVQPQRKILVVLSYVVFAIAVFMSSSLVQPSIVKIETQEVAHGIFTPVPVGNGQYGTARFMTCQEMEQSFAIAGVYRWNGNERALS